VRRLSDEELDVVERAAGRIADSYSERFEAHPSQSDYLFEDNYIFVRQSVQRERRRRSSD